VAALEGFVDGMDLHNPADGKSADFNECQPAKIFGLQNAELTFVLQHDIGLMVQCAPVYCPDAVSKPVMIQGYAVVGIMHVVVVDGRKTHQKNGPPMKGRACSALVSGIAARTVLGGAAAISRQVSTNLVGSSTFGAAG
jgi:hypothetical protein